MRRAFDVCAALVGCAVFSPVWALLAVAIKLEDGGTVFFPQERLGAGRAPFVVFKFRSMRDDEVTRVGHWVRRTGIDETAQFLNVLRGDMRMIGPRPLTAEDVTRLGWDGADMDWRWERPPGISGLAQIFGGRGAALSVAQDELYARVSSIALDVELVTISFAMNVLGKGRVRGWLSGHRYRLV